MLGQIGFVTPDDPSDPSINETELMARGVYGLDTWELKIPVCLSILGGKPYQRVAYHFLPPACACVKGL